jgi:hypothetical protein
LFHHEKKRECEEKTKKSLPVRPRARGGAGKKIVLRKI